MNDPWIKPLWRWVLDPVVDFLYFQVQAAINNQAPGRAAIYLRLSLAIDRRPMELELTSADGSFSLTIGVDQKGIKVRK